MTSKKSNAKVRPATGRLGILTPGLGAVATTFIAGVLGGLALGQARRPRPAAGMSAFMAVVARREDCMQDPSSHDQTALDH